MTDRELMQQALDALTAYDGTNGESKRKRVLAALRERLAQPEQEPVWIQPNHLQLARRAPFLCRVEPKQRDDFVPLYTAPPQRNPLTEKRIEELYSFWIVDCQDIVGFARAIERHKAKPQMKPCAGRNCGSTDPNLHSAECFEDYEKATGMVEQEPKCAVIVEVFGKDWRLDYMSLPVGKHKLYTQQYAYTAPSQRKPLPPQSPCEMTQAEGKMFKLGWLECEAAHGIKGDA